MGYRKKIVVLIPCYNEEKGLGGVIDNIPRDTLGLLGYDVEVLVIDNNSSDNTVAIARSRKVRVIHEYRQGKGFALITGFNSVPEDADIVVMIDGDDTYKTKEMLRLIEPLDSNFCDVVIGTRLNGKMSKESMTYFNRVGNWFLTFLVRVAYHGNVTDVCTGYVAWKREVIDQLKNYLKSDGFSIEMEMITKMIRMGCEIFSVPISYNVRGGSSTLRPIKDGVVIFSTWLKNLHWIPEKPIKEDISYKLPTSKEVFVSK